MPPSTPGPELAKAVLLTAAAYLAVRLALHAKDPAWNDPPVGLLIMAVPVVILLVGAGAAWSAGRRRPPCSAHDDTRLR